MDGSQAHDWAFFQWAAAGFLIGLGFVGQFTIGLPFLLAGVILLVVLLRGSSGWPADLGLVAGAGIVCLLIALISAISGDVSPVVWATVGVPLTVASSTAFWWFRCRPESA